MGFRGAVVVLKEARTRYRCRHCGDTGSGRGVANERDRSRDRDRGTDGGSECKGADGSGRVTGWNRNIRARAVLEKYGTDALCV